jgi:hypothetical protein
MNTLSRPRSLAAQKRLLLPPKIVIDSLATVDTSNTTLSGCTRTTLNYTSHNPRVRDRRIGFRVRRNKRMRRRAYHTRNVRRNQLRGMQSHRADCRRTLRSRASAQRQLSTLNRYITTATGRITTTNKKQPSVLSEKLLRRLQSRMRPRLHTHVIQNIRRLYLTRSYKHIDTARQDVLRYAQSVQTACNIERSSSS